MNITILTSDKKHSIKPYLLEWANIHSKHNNIHIVYSLDKVKSGDILFLISCSYIVKSDVRDRFRKTFVIHASNLPKGRGWSPHIWSIINGESTIYVSLIEAMDKVDTGDIWNQKKIYFEGHELLNEINNKLFKVELDLMASVVLDLDALSPIKQKGDSGAYLPKRTPDDSELDLSKSIDDQFNLLRVVDSSKFPAFFIKNGIKYIIKISKDSKD